MSATPNATSAKYTIRQDATLARAFEIMERAEVAHVEACAQVALFDCMNEGRRYSEYPRRPKFSTIKKLLAIH